jgi:hypothetical protein
MLSSWGSFGMIKKLRFEDDKGNKWFGPHYQPIHLIRQYHGEHVALYFAWLGLYTRWLVTPMLLGICTMLGYLVWDQDNNRFAVVYSVFLSLWSTMFLGAWERTNNELKFQWGSEGFEDTEKPRPQFRGRFIRSDQVRDVSIFVRPVLTEIYLCHACSSHEIHGTDAGVGADEAVQRRPGAGNAGDRLRDEDGRRAPSSQPPRPCLNDAPCPSFTSHGASIMLQ